MINNYFILEDNEQKGPFTHEDMMDMGITSNTFVLSPLSENWQYATELPEFYIYFETQGVYVPIKKNLANFWWRTLAYIIDYILLVIVMGIIGAILGAYSSIMQNNHFYEINDWQFLLRFIAVIIFLFYNTLFESLTTQGSIGKIICKMVVVNADGRRLRPGKALLRNGAKLISGLICGFGFFCVLWDSRRQGLHDNLAKTYVIHKRN
ncbi:MAG: RDD family protein [Mucilaginibacter sp.]